MNSRTKGKRGELEAAKAIAEAWGCEARRGQQFAGGTDSPDVAHSIAGVHIEVKRTERLSLYTAVEQAGRDAGAAVPVVLHRMNRKPWLLVVPLERSLELATILTAAATAGVQRDDNEDSQRRPA